MIFTVTASPSVDYYMEFDSLNAGKMNRARKTRLVPGGKGLNVSIVLARLGIKSRVLGFYAGDTGARIAKMLADRGICHALIPLQHGESRINVKLCARYETECNASGPVVPQEALETLEKTVSALVPGDTLVLGGSAPQGARPDYYARLLDIANQRSVLTVLDTSGEPLRCGLSARPWLVKPNAVELAELAGHSIQTLKGVCAAASAVQRQGARNVLVSLGGKGALLITEKGDIWRGWPPQGTVIGTVGAGDSMVAGFLAGWLAAGDPQHALRSALAAGSAAALSEWLAEPEEYQRCFSQLPALQRITDL